MTAKASAPNCERTPTPVCPGCGYTLTTDDMLDSKHDLFALAPNETREAIKCPSCDAEFWVQGGYQPHYTSSFAEEDL
jgi:hypothetical protein